MHGQREHGRTKASYMLKQWKMFYLKNFFRTFGRTTWESRIHHSPMYGSFQSFTVRKSMQFVPASTNKHSGRRIYEVGVCGVFWYNMRSKAERSRGWFRSSQMSPDTPEFFLLSFQLLQSIGFIFMFVSSCPQKAARAPSIAPYLKAGQSQVSL